LPTPPNAEHLDFRGIQAFDDKTAIVMSSGLGSLSRLYKTTDACRTWTLLFTNPDPEGAWDAVHFVYGEPQRPYRVGVLMGDPVNGKFVHYSTYDFGGHWMRAADEVSVSAREGESLFAASNSAYIYGNGSDIFVTGGSSGSRSRVLSEYVKHDPHVSWKFVGGNVPLAFGESAGAFSTASSHTAVAQPDTFVPTAPDPNRVFFTDMTATYVAVGGDYEKTDKSSETAAFSTDGGQHWKSSTTPPHGFRSAVAYDAPTKTWITVGPNGTDISTDDGRNWRALRPTPTDSPNADRDWNALSLPFVVGPHGRIGKFRPEALIPPQPAAAKTSQP
jgi:hypothetical protein